MTSGIELALPQSRPQAQPAVGVPEAIGLQVPESEPLRTQREIEFEAARQRGDRLGMATALRETWRDIESSARLDTVEDGEPRPNRALPDDFSDLEHLDNDAVKAAWEMRTAYTEECMAWERAHKMRRHPRTYDVKKSRGEVQGPRGKVKYRRMDPRLVIHEDSSDVNPTPVILIGGFGTGPASTAAAAKEICMTGARQVVTMDDPRPKGVRSGETPIHEDIDAYYNESAHNLLAVIEKEANGDPNYQVDLILQSGAVQGIAAALERIAQLDGDNPLPLRIRQIVLDSASGLIGEDNTKSLVRRFAGDATHGAPFRSIYSRDPKQMLKYVWKFFSTTARNTGHNADGVRAIARTHTDRDPLHRLRAHGTLVHQLSAHSDPVFPVDLVHQRMSLDEVDENGRLHIGNADSIAERSYEQAPHGALLFSQKRLGMGAQADLQLLEGFRTQGSMQEIAARFAQAQEAKRLKKRLMIAGATALVSAGISYFALPALFGGHEASGTLAKIPGADGGTAHTPTGGEGSHPPVDPTGGATGGEVAHTPTTTIVAGEGQTVWQNFANVFGADQAMTKIIEAGHAYASAHEGVTFHVVKGSGAVYFDTPDGPVWGAPELTKMLASAL